MNFEPVAARVGPKAHVQDGGGCVMAKKKSAKKNPAKTRERARELAVTGELLELLPESARWDPLPGSPGHQAPELPSEDAEDDDGRNESAWLVEEGAAAAEDELAASGRKGRRKQPDATTS